MLNCNKSNGFTLVELMIAGVLIGITGLIIYGAATGGSVTVPGLPNKQQCIDAGGKWSEGIQYGRITQLCTYN
jgi:prepilin-type N-terminal cleavage/methylation domain-containing protein